MKSKFYNGIVNVLGPVVRVLFRLHYHGFENEPDESEGPYIVISNHISNADPVFISAGKLKQQPHYMAKKELFKVPLVNLLVKGLGAYPVDRGGADVSAIKNTIKMLKAGKCVGIFPQGHRQMGISPREADLKNGAAMIAVRAETTVLPCYIRTKKNRFAFFRRVDVYMGKPVKFEELGYNPEVAGEYTRITSLIFERVCELYDSAETEDTGNDK